MEEAPPGVVEQPATPEFKEDQEEQPAAEEDKTDEIEGIN